MAFALVGSVGTVVSGANNASVTPTFGTGETRTAGNLLIGWVMAGGGGTAIATAPTGWSVGPSVQGTTCAFTIIYKVATGSDANPVIAAGGNGVNWDAQVAEFSGGAVSNVIDQTGSTSGSTSPITATAGGADVASGELVIYCSGGRFTGAVTTTQTVALNNGATANTTANTTSNSNRWAFGWGITTGNSGANTAQLTFASNTSLGSDAVVLASFKLPGTSNVSTLTAGLSFSGAQVKQDNNNQTASLSFSGSQTRAIKKGITAGLSFVGSNVRATTKRLTSGSLSFVGSIVKKTSHFFTTGSLSFVTGPGSGTNNYTSTLTASLSFVGNQARFISKSMTASLSFIGSILKSTRHLFTGGLSFVGSVLAKHLYNMIFSVASLSFSGAMTRNTIKKTTASLSFSGSIIKQSRKKLTTATISFSGAFKKSFVKTFAASISFLGNFIAAKNFIPPVWNYITATIGTLFQIGIVNDISSANIVTSDTIENVNSQSASGIETGENDNTNISTTNTNENIGG